MADRPDGYYAKGRALDGPFKTADEAAALAQEWVDIGSCEVAWVELLRDGEKVEWDGKNDDWVMRRKK